MSEKVLYQSKPKLKWNGAEREDWIKDLKQTLVLLPGFSKAYFFGSFARKEESDWSDVDLIVILKDDGTKNLEDQKQKYWKNLEFVSQALRRFPDVDLLVYTESQWEKLQSEPNPIGFWKDVERDLKLL